MEQLFLLEVVVDSIYFQSVGMVPQKKQVVIMVTFGNLVTLEIRTDTLGALDHAGENKGTELEINFGKSYLFFAKPDDLRNALDKCPLEVVVNNKATQSVIGNVVVAWESYFSDMLASCNDNVGYITPAFQANIYDLRHKDLIIGDIDICVRLSCFGKSISTNVQIVKPPKDAGAPGNTKFLFKSANAATTYECQIFGMGTSQEFIPIAALYQTVDVPTQSHDMKEFKNHRSSDTLVPESRVPSAFVMDMPVRDFNPIDLKNLADLLTGHRESLIVRPEDMMFTNYEQLMEIQQESTSSGGTSDSSSLDLKNLTVEKIEKQLCKNKDCPAAKMFKEFGIGPLATCKGLGTIMNKDEVKVPTTYGMTETFGHADRYGPFGLYARPKRPDQPFIARDSHSSMKKVSSEATTGKCKRACKHNCNKLRGGNARDILIRLRGGGINHAAQEILKSFKEDPLPNGEVPECGDEDLDSGGIKALFTKHLNIKFRLRGGGRNEEEVEDNSPMSKCRELMDEFDKVVCAYKRALGPCGKAICPFAQNIVNEKCRLACPGTRPLTAGTDDTTTDITTVSSCPGPEEEMSACGNDTCEYRRPDISPVAEEFKKSQLKSACGDPSCAYVKQRLKCPADDDDGGIKLHELPRNCGGPKCPYTPIDPLPPIHWDCPEPLPKGGICRNRDCPLVRKQHIIECSFTAPRPPCGQGTCPYAIPPPCDFKGCPFGPLIEPCPSFCPYRKDPCPRKCPYALEIPTEPCLDPTCAFNIAAAGVSPDQQGAAGECYHGPGGHSPDDPCDNLNCPYNTGGGFDADDEAEDELTPCDPSTCKAASGGPYECDDCVIPEDTCDCDRDQGGRGQGDRSSRQIKKNSLPQQEDQTNGPVSEDQLAYRESDAPRRRSKDVEPPIEKSEVILNQNNVGPKHQRNSKSSRNSAASRKQLQQLGAPAKPRISANLQEPFPNQPQAGQQAANNGIPPSSNGTHRSHKRKHRSQFVYDEGDMYPGIHVGHKYCNVPPLNVPKNMGWLWNIKSHVGRLKHRRGWRPGAISKTIAARIEEHRRLLGILPPASQKPNKRRMKKKKDGTYGGYESESDEEIAPKPTLQIKKKDGCYWITMNPLKDPATLEDNENPYMDCTPMQFKITKPAEVKEETGSCFCSGEEGGADGAEPEATDSELDIEFTPPAGIIHPEKHRRKKNIVHIETQYDTSDFQPPQLQLEGKKKGKKGKKDKKGKKGKKGGKGGKKKKK